MSNQYCSRSSAVQAAIEKSKTSPLGLYVNWVEDDCWEVSIYEEYEDQEYYLGGKLMQPEHSGFESYNEL